MGGLEAFKKFMSIDRRMLPIKMHYLLFSLAICSVMSYFPIMAKNIGLSPSAVGIIYTICPFVTVVTNPLFGWITDRLKKVKLVVIMMIIIQTPLFIGIVFVPSIPTDILTFSVKLTCPSNTSYVVGSPKFPTLIPNNMSLKCNANCEECLQIEASPSLDDRMLCGKDIHMETKPLYNISSDFLQVVNISINGTDLSPWCHEDPSSKCQIKCNYETGNKQKDKNEFATYQYWTLLMLMVTSLALANATIAIGDAACYEALAGRVNQFGKQRVWLTVGWGVGTMLTGYFLDLTNPNKEEKQNFSYCAYVMLVLIIFDIISLTQATLTKSTESKHILKDIGKIFARPHPIFFAAAILLIGAVSGIQWNFAFWYLEELGASKFLLGLTIAIFCIVVEAPFMFISGWVVKRIGRDNSLFLTFLTLATWFISASFIRNPWWFLLLNLTQGPSYGLFYVAMSSYGKLATAPGTEATMQTVLNAVFHGLGVGSGSLLGGLAYDLYGGRITFRYTGFISVGAAIVFKLLTAFVAGENTAICKEKYKPQLRFPTSQKRRCQRVKIFTPFADRVS